MKWKKRKRRKLVDCKGRERERGREMHLRLIEGRTEGKITNESEKKEEMK